MEFDNAAADFGRQMHHVSIQVGIVRTGAEIRASNGKKSQQDHCRNRPKADQGAHPFADENEDHLVTEPKQPDQQSASHGDAKVGQWRRNQILVEPKHAEDLAQNDCN